jgi:Flp pilus assembly protein TadD
MTFAPAARAVLFMTLITAGGLTPALAQKGVRSIHTDLNGLAVKKIVGESRRMELSHEEHRAIKKIEAALAVKNYEGAAAAIGIASQIAQTSDAKYTVAALQHQLGVETHNLPLQDQAIDAALASGVASVNMQAELYRMQGMAGLRDKNYAKAERALGKYAELAPNDPEPYVLLAEVKSRVGQPAEALSLVERAVAIKASARQPVPEKWLNARRVLAAQAGTEQR